MKKVKITVLKTTFDEELARESGAGEGLFYYGDWIRKPGVAICALQRRAAPCKSAFISTICVIKRWFRILAV